MCSAHGDVLELEYSKTFVGCGGLELLLKKNGKPRTFHEMRYRFYFSFLTLYILINSNITLQLCKWIKTPGEFCDYFCQQTLAVHEQALHNEVRKHNNPSAYITFVGGNEITDVIIQVSTSHI